MTVLFAALVGFLAGRMLWLGMRKAWSIQALQRKNYQGVSVPTAAGVTLGFSLIVIEGVRAVFGAAGIGEEPGLTPLRAAMLVVVLGFTALGLIDDLIGAGPAKGFSGHMKALARGELTTGGLKLIGGTAVSLVGAALMGADGLAALILDAAIIALAANLANMFDMRPGRVGKMGILAFVVMAALVGLDASLVATAIIVGAAAALMLDDLREKLMFGDTGANALGAALGLGLVAVTASTGRVVSVVVLLALNLLSEMVPFTKIIEKVPPFRAFDEMGRKKAASIDVRQAKAAETEEPFSTGQPNRPVRATVGGAHVGMSAGNVGVREQSPFAPSEPRDPGPTPPAPSRAERPSDDLFGFDRPGSAPQPEVDRDPFGEDESSPPRSDPNKWRDGGPEDDRPERRDW